MIVLAAADIHGNWETYRWLVEVVDTHHPDLVVLAGDLLGAPESYSTVEADQTEHAERVVQLLSPISVPVLYVMGNDDWIALPPRPGWHSLHLQRREFGEFQFVGYQNTPRFMGGPNERTEQEIEEELSQIEGLLDGQTILVTHGPAFGVLDGGHGSTRLWQIFSSGHPSEPISTAIAIKTSEGLAVTSTWRLDTKGGLC